MGVSTDLISQFIKATKDDPAPKKETTVHGTVVKDQNGEMKVRLDGSDIDTPVSSTVDLNDGDRVVVMIKNHTATVTGNASDPSAGNKQVGVVRDSVEGLRVIVADKVSTEVLEAAIATIDELIAKKASIEQLEADKAVINELIAKKASIEQLEADKAVINELIAKKLSVEEFNAEKATIDQLIAAKVSIEQLEADKAAINELIAKKVSIEQLEAERAEIDELLAKKVTIDALEAEKATINELIAKKASIEQLTAARAEIDELLAKKVSTETLEAEKAAINELIAKKIDTESADIKYAQIDFSNIDTAWMKKFFSESGMIKDVYSENATITGYLVGVTIKGDLIETNTLKADKLVVLGKDGLYYKLNVNVDDDIDWEKLTEEEQLQNGLHGKSIIAKTITAEKVSVSDLVAFGADIGGFHISNHAIYSGVKASLDNTTNGLFMDRYGQMALGDSERYLKFQKASENLIPYPYYETTKTVNGITFTDNGDGSITINGTCTGSVSFTFGRFQVTPGRDYFLKVLPIIGGFGSIYAYVYTGDEADIVYDLGDGAKFTPNESYASSAIVVMTGQTCNNLVIRPMLNKGPEALPYEPYGRPSRLEISADTVSFGGTPVDEYVNAEIGGVSSEITHLSNELVAMPNKGRNLLLNTKAFEGPNLVNGTYGSLLTDVYNGLKIRRGDAIGAYIDIAQFNGIYPKKLGAEYTLSFYARGTGTLETFFYGASNYLRVARGISSAGAESTSGDGWMPHTLSKDWTRHWVTWKLAESRNLWNSGDIVATGYTYYITNVFEHLTPNKQYVLSWTYSSNGTADAQNMMIVYTEAGGVNINNGVSFAMTEEQINTLIRAYAYFGSDATSGSMTNIMLNEGTEALPYEPYAGNISVEKQVLFRSMPGNSADICGVKLEHGAAATEWSEAPEDIEQERADLKSATEQLADNLDTVRSESARSAAALQSEVTGVKQYFQYDKNVGVTIRGRAEASKNLAYSSVTEALEHSGISIAVEKDSSSVILNGTSSEVFVNHCLRSFALPAGTYTLSVDGLNISTIELDRIYLVDSSGAVLVNHVQTGRPGTFILDRASVCQVNIVFNTGSTYSDTEIRIMLNAGSEALPYERYVKPTNQYLLLDNDEIKIMNGEDEVQRFDAYGNAIIPSLKVETQLDLLGLIFTRDEDGTINCVYRGGNA